MSNQMRRAMRIARVFPRVTNATPFDEMTFYGPPGMLFLPEIDESSGIRWEGTE